MPLIKFKGLYPNWKLKSHGTHQFEPRKPFWASLHVFGAPKSGISPGLNPLDAPFFFVMQKISTTFLLHTNETRNGIYGINHILVYQLSRSFLGLLHQIASDLAAFGNDSLFSRQLRVLGRWPLGRGNARLVILDQSLASTVMVKWLAIIRFICNDGLNIMF